MESQLQDAKDVDKVAKSFTELLKTPVVSAARYDETADAISIYSEWSYDDVSKKESLGFVKTFTVLKSSLTADSKTPTISIPSTPIPHSVKLTAFSKSGSKKAVVTNSSKAAGNEGEPDEHLQIFSNEKLLKTYDLKELDKHKGVYTAAFWGSRMVWSQDESKLAYLAEKKIAKAKPFFTSYAKLGSNKSSDEAETKEQDEGKGQEFAYRQSWGEQLTTAVESVIVVLDYEKDEFQIVPLADHIFPSDLQWVNNSTIIGTAYRRSNYKLGLIFCTNRDSRIFRVDVDGSNFQFLSVNGMAAFSPRVRPDSKFVVWQQRRITGTHAAATEVVGTSLADLNVSHHDVKPIYSLSPDNRVPLYSAFPQNCWTEDGSKLCTVTENEVDCVFLIFNFDGDQLKSVSEPIKNITGVRWVGKKYVLANRSTSTEPSYLVLLDITANPVTIHQVSQPEQVLKNPMKRLVVPGSVSPASLYYGPSGGNIKPKSVPLVVIPHGGPNCVYTDGFSPEGSLWLKLGFGILRINYVGSTGGSTDNSEKLLGRIGVDDVKDCERVLKTLLETEPSIDPEQIVVYGGSHDSPQHIKSTHKGPGPDKANSSPIDHVFRSRVYIFEAGGFLGAHLSSSYPEIFKAVALINPVTDLIGHVGTTDIPDWCYRQAGANLVTNFAVPLHMDTLENARIFMECSPIKHVNKVQAPTLLLLGSEDLRVPMSQGLAYHRALQLAGKITEVRLYKDCHSLMKPPHRFDVWMQITLWFLRHLKKTV